MSSRPPENALARWVTVVGAVVMACFCASWALTALDEDSRFAPEQPVAVATVVDVEVTRGLVSMEVEFRTGAGEEVRTWVDQANPLRVGESLEVRYDPKDPERYVRDVRAGGSTVWVVGLAVTGLALLVVVLLAGIGVPFGFPARTVWIRPRNAGRRSSDGTAGR